MYVAFGFVQVTVTGQEPQFVINTIHGIFNYDAGMRAYPAFNHDDSECLGISWQRELQPLNNLQMPC